MNSTTGEILTDPHEYFSALSSKSPTAEALEKSAPGIQVLASLAICDGHMDADEVQAILRFVDEHSHTHNVDWNIVEAYIKAVWPDIRAYDRAVIRLRPAGTDEKRRVVRAAKNLVLADGILRREETELMSILLGSAVH